MLPCVCGVKKKKKGWGGECICSIYKTRHSHKGQRPTHRTISWSFPYKCQVQLEFTFRFSQPVTGPLSLPLLSLGLLRDGLNHGNHLVITQRTQALLQTWDKRRRLRPGQAQKQILRTLSRSETAQSLSVLSTEFHGQRGLFGATCFTAVLAHSMHWPQSKRKKRHACCYF